MTPLSLGVVDQVPVPSGRTAAEAVEASLRLAAHAEAFGYSRIWYAEHHSTNSFACAQPGAFVALAAARTSRLRLGSGGVLLPHYSPLEVAETYRLLAAGFPDRIDLGVGRAPGGDARAVEALRYGRGGVPPQHFGRQLADLLGWLRDGYGADGAFGRVRAMPRGIPAVPVWLLGSSGASAALAGELGLGYAFAQFISGEDGRGAVEVYRERFRPSPEFPEPRVVPAVGVLCAETGVEAQRLASSLELWRARIVRGIDRGIPSPEEAAAELGPRAPEQSRRVVVGDPARVAEELTRLAEHYDAAEVLTVTVTHDFAARERSLALVAGALGLDASGPTWREDRRDSIEGDQGHGAERERGRATAAGGHPPHGQRPHEHEMIAEVGEPGQRADPLERSEEGRLE